LLKPEWRDLFECQFHDALCGCHIDVNYEYILAAYDSVMSGAQARMQETSSVSSGGPAVVNGVVRLFNALPNPRRDIVRLPCEGMSIADASGRAVPCQADSGELAFVAEIGPGAPLITRFPNTAARSLNQSSRRPAERSPPGRTVGGHCRGPGTRHVRYGAWPGSLVPATDPLPDAC